ncbi:MAG: exo-alpha-sialidase [Polyangiaceae bacterium]|nr:exo-alpha-sialidase [Polyangiaceae bacterium]
MKNLDRCFVGTRKGLFVLERRAGRLVVKRTEFLGAQVSMVLYDPRQNTLLVAIKHGHFGAKLHRSTDQGATFEEIAAPVFPPKPEGVSDIDPIRKTERKWSVEQIWSLEVGGNAGELWLGTLPGGLFRSTDFGASWQLNRPLWDHPARSKWFGGGYDSPGIHSILVNPHNAADVYIGVSCGGLWRTLDGGETWQLATAGMVAEYMPPNLQTQGETQDPHRVAMCKAHPNVMWCQHHSSAYRTDDGGANWKELKALRPSRFGFAVAACPADPNTAWFVPAIKDEVRLPVDGKVTVARTTNGGKSFDVFSKGLPQEHAYDLVYRHGLDADSEGGALLMGSTTGSLWESFDGGESWNTVSNHLPPIYCVAWGYR